MNLPAAILCGSLVAALLADSGNDGSEVLKSTAQAYRDAIDYELVVETKVATEPGNDPPTKCRYRLAASRPRNSYTDEKVLSPISYQVQLGTDGNTVWAYSPTVKEYVEDGGKDLLTELSEQHARLFLRFQDLDRMPLDTTIEKADEVLRDDGPVHCVKILIQPRTRDGWEEHLWIEKDRHLVRKSILRQRSPVEVRVSTTRWRTIRVNKGTAVEFSFKRPDHASRTNQLRVP